MSSKVWLVTGCSQGFGQHFIASIVARGDKVIATARNVNDIKHLEVEGKVKTLTLDVAESEDSLKEKVQQAVDCFGRCDVLVNNAGYVLSGVWEELSHDDAMRQFSTNFFGAMNLTRAILPHFRAQGGGKIVFMSSISAWLGAAAGGPYSASKFALEGAVECLDKEVRHFNIQSYLIVLGQFRTKILAESNRKMSRQNRISEYDTIIDSISTRHEQTNGLQPGDPKQAVERILDVVREEGSMAGRKDLPLRIPLGSDAVQIMRNECLKTLAEIEEFQEFSSSTDYPETQSVPSYQ